MNVFDIIIVGAGASGLMLAGRGIQANQSVCIIDMGNTPARKIIVSGGGKCNFTNMHADHKHYFGKNPEFTRSALSRWTPRDTLNWVKSKNIKVHEKSPGQYFSDDAKNIINALLSTANGSQFIMDTSVQSAEKQDDIFVVKCTNNKTFYGKKLVIATGGISYSNLGTSDIGYKIAKQFGHKIIPPRPGLCPIKTNIFDSSLSGISVPVEIIIDHEKIYDTMLFTHFGIGGPAIYRTSIRNIENGFTINLLPNCDTFNWLMEQKHTNGKKQIKNVLSIKLPERVAAFILQQNTKNIADLTKSEIQDITNRICNIKIEPKTFSLQNFNMAEVTSGGIDTTEVSSKTMESKLCPGLYFIGEVLDITGDLGGYNLQWAWASANAVPLNS